MKREQLEKQRKEVATISNLSLALAHEHKANQFDPPKEGAEVGEFCSPFHPSFGVFVDRLFGVTMGLQKAIVTL